MDGGIWTQNRYRIRKKVLAMTNVYWIEDGDGAMLGFSKQKLLSLKEDIRVFGDDRMSNELFRIKQENLVDSWGTFSILDSSTEQVIGRIRRNLASNYVWDEYQLLDANGQQYGKITERGGRGLARKFVPLGGLIPEHVCVEINGQEICEIKQQFKIIGDIWEVDLSRMPTYLDRRVLLSAMLMMGMVERERK